MRPGFCFVMYCGFGEEDGPFKRLLCVIQTELFPTALSVLSHVTPIVVQKMCFDF